MEKLQNISSKAILTTCNTRSGAVVVVNNEITESYMKFPDDPIVGRKPIR